MTLDNHPKRILVLRYRFIGDTLLTIPFLRALRAQYADAEIEMLISRDTMPLLQHCPYLDRLTPFEPRELGMLKSVWRLKKGQYDRAYVLKRSFSSALMVYLAGIPQRIGFDTDSRGWLLTQRVPYRQFEAHEADCYLDLLRPKKSEQHHVFDMSLDAWIPPSILAKAQTFLQPTVGPRVVLHATSTNMAKCWPIQHFRQLAQQLIETYQAQIYLLGIQKESQGYRVLINALPEALQPSVINLCGQTSLMETMALLKQMDLVVANDSGMIHMPAAVGTPVIAIFGPMDPQQWHPLSPQQTSLVNSNLPCRPCRMKITCDNRFPCLTEITPEKVMEACRAYLKS